MEERTNPTMGTASAVATRPLNRIPSFMNRPRRESVFSFDIVKLLVRCVTRSGGWLQRTLRPLRGEPRDYVRDFLVRHRFAGEISAPVGSAELRTAGNDNGAQALIADERKEGVIRDSASLCSSAAARAMAGLAVALEHERALRNISSGLRRVGRRIGSL